MNIAIASGARAGLTTDPERSKMEDAAPLRAVHTSNFPALLRQLGASLLVTTYQAGKLVLIRDEGDHLDGDRRAIGTRLQLPEKGWRAL